MNKQYHLGQIIYSIFIRIYARLYARLYIEQVLL